MQKDSVVFEIRCQARMTWPKVSLVDKNRALNYGLGLCVAALVVV